MNFGLSGAVVDVLGSNSETPLYLNPQNSVNTIFVEELAYRGLPALPNRHVVAFTLVGFTACASESSNRCEPIKGAPIGDQLMIHVRATLRRGPS